MENLKTDNNNMDMEMYETKDLKIASYLYATRQLEFQGVRRTDGQAVYFKFTPKDKAEELEKGYFLRDREPQIPAKDLFNAMDDLKDIIFSRT